MNPADGGSAVSQPGQIGIVRPSTGPAGAPETGAASGVSGPSPGERRGPARAVVLLIVLIVGALAAAAGGAYLVATRGEVTSDDAQVEGHIVPVLARVGGYVASVGVTENQPVRAGDVLVRLDDRDLRARLQQAEADVTTGEAAVGTAGRPGQVAAQLAVARAGVEQARAAVRRTSADLERYRALSEGNVVSRQQLDAAEAAATTASAQLTAAQDQVTAAGAALQAAVARLASLRAAREQAALQLSYGAIAAPVTGVVARKSVEVGQFVQPGQQLMTVVPLHDVWVVANLKETQLRGVKPGERADITVDTYPGHRFPGRVESVSPATGARFSLLPPDNATGNFTKVVQRVPVKVVLTDPPDAGRPLRPGLSARVTIHTRRS